MCRAMQQGLLVSRPYGECAAYDFIVQAYLPPAGRPRRRPRLRLVQVKSVCGKDRQGRYTVNTRRSYSRAYRSDELDFFACWIVPLDLWYIIPAAAVVPQKCVHLYPDVLHSRGKHERYKDAWHLLR